MKKSKLAELEKEEGNDLGESLERLLLNRNFSKREVDTVVGLLARDKRVVTAIIDEFEDDDDSGSSATVSAVVTFVSFVCFGLIPLIATVFVNIFEPFLSSCIWTGLTLLCLGYFKVRWFPGLICIPLSEYGLLCTCSHG